MGLDEQKEEREVLDSIFPDEITDINDTSYRVSINLDLPPHAAESEEPLIVYLNVEYPPTYPDIAPDLDLSSPPNVGKHPLLDLQADKAQLLDSLSSTIEDSMGMAMVFGLVTQLKDAAETLMADRQRQAEEIVEVKKREAEEVENRKFHGEKVTREKFLAWREKFKKEMEEKEKTEREAEEAEAKSKRVRIEEKRLTGKELWARGLVGKGEGEEAEVEDGLVNNVDGLKVSA